MGKYSVHTLARWAGTLRWWSYQVFIMDFCNRFFKDSKTKRFRSALFNILLSCNYLLYVQNDTLNSSTRFEKYSYHFLLDRSGFFDSPSQNFVLWQLAHLNTIDRFRNLPRCCLHIEIISYRTFLASNGTKSHVVLSAPQSVYVTLRDNIVSSSANNHAQLNELPVNLGLRVSSIC